MSIWHPQLSSAIRGGRQLFHYSYWKTYRASHLVLNNSSPAQRVALDQLWEEREKSGIWLTVVCPVSVCIKAIVRRHHVRRVRAALAAVFNEHGQGRNRKAMGFQTPALQGTLHVVLLSPIIQSKGSEIRRECATMVGRLLKEQGQALSSSKHRQQTTKGSSNSSRTPNHGKELKFGDKTKRRFESPSNNDHMRKLNIKTLRIQPESDPVRRGAYNPADQAPDAVPG